MTTTAGHQPGQNKLTFFSDTDYKIAEAYLCVGLALEGAWQVGLPLLEEHLEPGHGLPPAFP